ncbi:phosphatidylserine decarboxylase [Malassezia sp. CBS 17886]|nr:phosphatidylserine decarboxylase [Malassezia sp. CBS 17886]
MWTVGKRTTAAPRILSMAVRPGARAALLARAYARTPEDAERAANTVRGHGSERTRRESLRHVEERRGAAGGGGEGAGSMWRRAAATWRSTPLKWTPLPAVLGALVLVGVQAHREWQKGERAAPIVDADGLSLYVLGALPLNTISRLWGWGNSLTLPVWFRPYGFRLYAWIFGCNLDEMKDKDLTHYASLGEFFSRELKEGVRPIAPTALVSPADGTVLHLGVIEGDRVEQVKGLTYSLDTFLGIDVPAQAQHAVHEEDRATNYSLADEERFANLNGIDYSLEQLLGDQHGRKRLRSYLFGWVKGTWRLIRHSVMWRSDRRTRDLDDEESDADDAGIPTSDSPENLGHLANVAYKLGTEAIPSFDCGPRLTPESMRPGHQLFFCVVYLAPGDYHRFHSPTNWVVDLRRHFRGELYSVSPYVASRMPNLFLLNERVALLGRWRYGFFGMVPIGATNVGSIRINFDRNLRTNAHVDRMHSGTYSEATYNAASRILGGQPLGAGEEMGAFLLGSTVVLVFEAPENFRFSVNPGEKVYTGEPLGDVEGKARTEA